MPEIACTRDYVRIALVAFLSALKEELIPIAKKWPKGKERYASIIAGAHDDGDASMFYLIDDEHDEDASIAFPKTSEQHDVLYATAKEMYKGLRYAEIMIPYMFDFFYTENGIIRITACVNVVDDRLPENALYQTAKKIAVDMATMLNETGQFGTVKVYEGDDDDKVGFKADTHCNYYVGFRLNFQI